MKVDWVDWLVTPLPSSVAKSKGLMIKQYMGVAPSTFQEVYIYVCIRLFLVGHFLGEFFVRLKLMNKNINHFIQLQTFST